MSLPPRLLPSELSPHHEHGHLSRGPLLPCGRPPECRTRGPTPFTPGFPRRPRQSTRLPGSPVGYGLPFHDREGRFPVPLGAARPGSPLPLTSPASELRSRAESVPPAEAGGRCSPGLSPLQGLLPVDSGSLTRPSARRAAPEDAPRLGSTPRSPRAARATRGPRTRAPVRERTDPRAVTLAAG
jgi:hypothetical protein